MTNPEGLFEDNAPLLEHFIKLSGWKVDSFAVSSVEELETPIYYHDDYRPDSLLSGQKIDFTVSISSKTYPYTLYFEDSGPVNLDDCDEPWKHPTEGVRYRFIIEHDYKGWSVRDVYGKTGDVNDLSFTDQKLWSLIDIYVTCYQEIVTPNGSENTSVYSFYHNHLEATVMDMRPPSLYSIEPWFNEIPPNWRFISDYGNTSSSTLPYVRQRWSPFFGQGDKLSSGLNEDGFYGQGYAETVCGRVQVTGCAGGDPWGTDAGGTGFETWRASDDDRPMEAPGDRRHGKPFFW